MLDTLKFVRGAVSNSETGSPILTHFCITGGRIQGTNGRVAIEAEAPELEKISVVVPADRFLKAVDVCDGKQKYRVLDSGKLVIEHKPFRATLPTVPVLDFPTSKPTEGKPVKVGAGLVEALKLLRPFIGGDALAGRRWTNTVMLTAGRAYATNSAMLASISAPKFKQTLIIPVYLIDELMRIGDDPDSFCADDISITFFWGTRWLRGQLINEQWPAEKIVELLGFDIELKDVPKDLRIAVEDVKAFTHKDHPVIYFNNDKVTTAVGETHAQYEGFDMVGEAAFHAENILPMLARSKRMSVCDNRGYFEGDYNFKGVMIGLRMQQGETVGAS